MFGTREAATTVSYQLLMFDLNWVKQSFLNDSVRQFKIFADSNLKHFRQHIVDLSFGRTALFL